MQHLHTEEQEQTSMDATSTIRATVCAAAMIITLQSCTTEQPEPPSQPPEPIEFTGYDMTDNAGKALQNLEVFLNSVTRTSTTIPKHIQNSSNFTTETTNLIDHSDIWDDLAQCESGGNWSYPPVSGGFSGGIMFHIATWQAMGGLNYAPDAYLATREQQIKVATQVLDASGWGAWPGCARKLGLR
jgi:hypothetical protein